MSNGCAFSKRISGILSPPHSVLIFAKMEEEKGIISNPDYLLQPSFRKILCNHSCVEVLRPSVSLVNCRDTNAALG